MSQAERRFVELGAAGGGHCPFRGLDAPFALEYTVGEIEAEVNCWSDEISQILRMFDCKQVD